MVGEAVNVTDSPLQIAPDGVATILTDGVTVVTDITIALDVAGEPVAQPELEVITQVTTSPFASVVDVKAAAVSPLISSRADGSG